MWNWIKSRWADRRGDWVATGDTEWRVVHEQPPYRREKKVGLYIDLKSGEQRWWALSRFGRPIQRILKGDKVLELYD